MRPLDYRRAAAFEISKIGEIHKSIADRQAYLRLERDRLWRLRIELPCAALDEAIEYIDSAIICIGEARRHLDGGK